MRRGTRGRTRSGGVLRRTLDTGTRLSPSPAAAIGAGSKSGPGTGCTLPVPEATGTSAVCPHTASWAATALPLSDGCES
jgi:hypothetical protein